MDKVSIRLGFSNFALITLLVSSLLSSCSSDTESGQGQRSADSHIGNARSYLLQGQYRAAVLEAKNALKKAPSAETANLLVDVYLELGHYQSARSVLESYAEKYPGLKIRLVETYLHLQKFHSAEEILSTIQPVAENQKHYQLYKARAKLGLGNEREAFSALGKLAQQYPDDKQVRMAQFLSVFKSGTPEESEQTLSKLLADFGEEPDVLLTASRVRFLQKNYSQTEEHLMSALHLTPQTDVLNPLRSGILHMLSKTLTQQGRYAEAAPYSKILKEANPEAEDAQKRLEEAFTALKSGQVDVGEEMLSKLRQQFPNLSTTDALLGLVNLEQGNYGKASEFFESSVDPEVAAPKLSAAAAITKLRLDEKQKAVDILETALRSNPESERLQVLYGLTTISDPAYQEKASKALEKAISLGASDIRVYSLLARYYGQANKAKALEVLNKASQTFSDSQDQLNIYSSYIDLGFDSQAASYAKKSRSSQPNSETGWLMDAIGKIKNNQQKAANVSLTKAVKVNSKSDKAWFLLADNQLAAKQFDSAVKSFKEAIKINPEVGHYLRGLYVAESSRNKSFDKIEASMLEVAKNEKVKASILGYLAQQAIAQKKYAEGKRFIDKFKASTESTPERIEVLETQYAISQAQDQVLKSDNQAALAILQSVLEKYSGSVELLVRAGNLYLNENDWQNAEKIKLILQNLGGKHAVLATLFEADIHDKKGEFERAMSVLKSHWVVAKDARLGNAIYGLGVKRGLSIDPQFFSEWRSAQPGNPRPVFLEAMYVQAGDPDKSITLYERALELDGDIVPALNNLAWLYQEKNLLKKADLMASKALSLSPESPSILDTAGYIKMKMGDKKALALLEKARELAPKSKEIEEHYQQARKSL